MISPTISKSSAPRAVPALILLAGLGLSYLAFWGTGHFADDRARSVFELRIEWRAGDIQNKINDASVPVEALADFIPSQSALDPGDFHRFAVQARGDDPISRLAWAPLVTRAQRAQFEADARQSGLTNYAIGEFASNGTLHPDAERDEYLPTRLLERFDGTAPNLGFDLLSDKVRAAVVEDARDSGVPVVAPPLPFLSNPTGVRNYVIFWPVYSTGAVPATVAARHAAFSGVVIGVYPIDLLMKFAFQNTRQALGTLNLFIDHRDGEPYGVPMAIFHPETNRIELPIEMLGAPAPGSLRLARTFPLFGRDWTLVTDYSATIVNGQRSSSQWGFLALGLLMTFGFTAYVRGEQHRRQAVEAEVAERTRDLRETSERLRATTEQMKAIVDASPMAIVARDPARNVTVWNRAAEQLFGYSAAEIIGSPTPSGVTPDPEEWSRRFERVAKGEILRDLHTQRWRKDGKSIETISSLAPVFDSAGMLQGTVATIADMTERNAMQKQLQQAQKMEAIGHLTGGLAHDFNNLLGVVLGNLDILAESQEAGSEQRAVTDAAIHAAVRGAELTKQLLAFARQQPLASKLTDLNAVLNGSARLLRRVVGEQVTLELKVAENLWPVFIDASQLESAILNLAVNARDAMPNGGTLTLEARNVTLDAGAAELNPEAAAGNYVAFAISDTGTGMPPEIIAQAFDPFFSTKGSHGTGLGLSMVHGFVKQSGGHTKIYSEPGRGTTIRMYLPRAQEGEIEMEIPSIASKMTKGNEVILVVEDNKGLRDVALRQLQDLGYRTIPASDGAQALEIIQGGAPIDLLFTDVVMPGRMDGRALAQAARHLRPNLRVLFASGFTAAAASAAMSDEFGFNLLSKPYRKDELGRRVRAAIDSPDGLGT